MSESFVGENIKLISVRVYYKSNTIAVKEMMNHNQSLSLNFDDKELRRKAVDITNDYMNAIIDLWMNASS